jgi:hypothetical protein
LKIDARINNSPDRERVGRVGAPGLPHRSSMSGGGRIGLCRAVTTRQHMRLQRVFRESVRFETKRFSSESRRSPTAVLSSGVFCQ